MTTADEKRIARLALHRAIRRGELVAATHCENCGATSQQRLDGHHHNGYDEVHQLDVMWLCRSYHKKIHLGFDPKAAGAKGLANRSFEDVSRAIRKQIDALTPEQRKQRTAAAHAAHMKSMTPEKWAELSQIGNNAITAEQRRETGRRSGLKVPRTQLSMMGRKGSCRRWHGTECGCWERIGE